MLFGDHDEAGQAHVAMVARSLRGVGISARVAQLDGLPKGGDIRDWLKTHTQEDLDHVVAQAPRAEEQRQDETPEETTGKPVIEITTNMTVVVNATERAILDLPRGPYLFQRARQLCLIARGVKPPQWLHRPHRHP